jgi:hypothetical protein
VYGDTNALYTNSSDGIRQFTSGGLTDVWVQVSFIMLVAECGQLTSYHQLIRASAGTPAEGSPSLYCPENAVGVSNACETLDKIFYRSSRALTLSATRYNNESKFFARSVRP